MAGVSDNENKAIAKEWIEALSVGRVLDVGAGMGTYALLAKQANQHWTALEVFYPYVKMFGLNELYDEVFIGDARYMNYDKISHSIGWDLIIAADMLEHMSRDDAKQLIYDFSEQCKHLLICFPVEHHDQHAGEEGNDFETHVDHWTYDEMKMYLESDAGLSIEKSIHGAVLAYFLVRGRQ